MAAGRVEGMSGSAVVCRCAPPLARLHQGGRLHVLPGVGCFHEPNGTHGPFLGLTCPACGKRRDYRVDTSPSGASRRRDPASTPSAG